ncbi:MAG: sulfatase-like hydrolase/transferase [Bacteroidales bacterium]|nr:sulfatase-like hydrolase/transferase [Bacteroidales bacterium]
MKKRISVFLLYLVYWYLLFVVARIAFLLYYFEKSSQLSASEIVNTFIYGFKLDIAIGAYIAILPAFVLTVTALFQGRFIKYFYIAYSAIVILVCSTIIIGDLYMYGHWGFRIDATPLFYMTNPKAMIASVSTFTVITSLMAVLLMSGLLYYIYFKIFAKKLDSLQKSNKAVYVLLPVTLLLAIVLRGGFGIGSLSTSSAYFSQKQFANHSAINPIWNLGFSISESNDLQHKYLYYNEEEVTKLLAPIKSGNETTLNLLRNNRPNIILIIAESLTAKALVATGGRPGIMPELNKLIKEGVLFDHIYAASDRTDKGLAAVLAGYPSLPGSSPLKYQKLTEKLAFIPQKLKTAGYKNEFYYGGTLQFANYFAFLVQAGYDKMVSDKDFPPADLKSKWGAFDHVVLNRCLEDTPDNDTKFFKTVLTLTSHEPFDTPVVTVIKGNDDDSKYLNSLHYTDASIGDFIKEAKTRKWWDNTLIIIIADHGSMRPGNSEMWEKSKYHIPMIWLGGALNVHDTVISNMASQTDLAATLMSQLQINSDGFKFSKNILTSDYIPYSFFTYTGGFGFQKPDKLLIYNTVTDMYSKSVQKADSIFEKEGKAYLQSVYMDFYSKNK